MRKGMTILATLVVVMISASIDALAASVEFGNKTKSIFPDGQGSAGAFIGSFEDGTILFAGGSDFLGKRPWEGGRKSFLTDVYLLSPKGDSCNMSRMLNAQLPFGIANGCCVSIEKSIYLFGGVTDSGKNSTIFRVTRKGDSVKIEEVDRTPEDFHPSAAVLFKGNIYLHGIFNGKNALYRYSPQLKVWSRLSGCPERTLSEGSVLVSQHNGHEQALFLIGGRGYDEDGLFISDAVWEYLPVSDSWIKKAKYVLDDEPINLMYCSAVPYGSGHILVIGGDDGKEFIRRSELEEKINTSTQPDSLKTELTNAFVNHPGFYNKIFAYHTITDTWMTLGESPFPLPAVTSAVISSDKIYLISGEEKPGVRSNDIVTIKINDDISFGWVNYLVVIIYLCGMLGIGFYFSRKNNSTEQFFKGGGKIPWWAAGISIFATALSAITFLSIPAKAYAADWRMFMFNVPILLIVPIVIHFYLPYIKKLNVASVYKYLEDRFNLSIRYLASAFFCLFMFARIAIVLFLPSLALNAVTGLNIYLCIILMGVVTIIYCTLGGIEAVVWGDVIQGTLLVGGALLSFFWIIRGIDGGFSTMMTTAIDAQKFNIIDFSLDWTQPVFWVALVGGFANQLLTYTSDQSVVQRYLTVEDNSGTKKGLWLNGILAIPISLLFFAIGTGLFVFFRQNPNLLNIGMTNTDSIFPHYMMCQMPVGVAGLLIAAVFAAAMSTLSSNINSLTTVMTEDFYSNIRKNSTDSNKVRFARITGMIIGGLGVCMAIVLATFDIASLWDQFNFFLGLFTSGLGGLFMMGVFTKRINSVSAFVGFIGSIAVLLYCSTFTSISSTLYGFIGLISCFMIGYIASFILIRK